MTPAERFRARYAARQRRRRLHALVMAGAYGKALRMRSAMAKWKGDPKWRRKLKDAGLI